MGALRMRTNNNNNSNAEAGCTESASRAHHSCACTGLLWRAAVPPPHTHAHPHTCMKVRVCGWMELAASKHCSALCASEAGNTVQAAAVVSACTQSTSRVHTVPHGQTRHLSWSCSCAADMPLLNHSSQSCCCSLRASSSTSTAALCLPSRNRLWLTCTRRAGRPRDQDSAGAHQHCRMRRSPQLSRPAACAVAPGATDITCFRLAMLCGLSAVACWNSCRDCWS
jgi:hypothetical protein